MIDQKQPATPQRIMLLCYGGPLHSLSVSMRFNLDDDGCGFAVQSGYYELQDLPKIGQRFVFIGRNK